jgi:phage gpG-like protein
MDEEAQALTLGSSLDYMGYHHTGTRRMPRRDPIDFTQAQADRITKPITDKLKQLIDNAKLRDIRGF